MGEGECEALPEEQPRKPRHRKKFLYNTILQQMEFYFSDSNLSKDRFLSQLLFDSSEIDIEIFLNFNKIKKLNCSIEDIQKAIRKSDLIGLTEDGLKILRKEPIKIKENVDFCTIYVENIKADANHETLSQVFSDFGNVVYVSVPKYKHNKTNKGFAFIEYETEEQAKDAIAFFESIGCKIPSEKNPEELRSIVTFGADKPEIELPQHELKNKEDAKEPEEKVTKRKFSTEEIKEEIDQSKKQKTESKDTDDLSENKKQKTEVEEEGKKRKLSCEETEGSKKLKTEKEKPVSEKLADDASENLKQKTEGDEEGNHSDELDDAKKKKKNKKEKRKNFIKDLGMQVLSKKEWKKLRNNYLDLQRKKMKEFKQYLYKQKYGQKGYNKKYTEEVEEEHKESKEISEEVNKLSYTPGVIVKLRLPEPCIDVKKLKNEIKTVSPEVKYVDIPLPAGSEEVFIRFADKDAASEFCNKEFNGEKTVMSGDEEKNYWSKIENDRTVKFQKLVKKQRGREKLLKKAEKESAKHMRFDDNELV